MHFHRSDQSASINSTAKEDISVAIRSFTIDQIFSFHMPFFKQISHATSMFNCSRTNYVGTTRPILNTFRPFPNLENAQSNTFCRYYLIYTKRIGVYRAKQLCMLRMLRFRWFGTSKLEDRRERALDSCRTCMLREIIF